MAEKSLISVVDDDQAVRASMRRLLRSFGYAVEIFSSAADFLGSPYRHATACLIADVHMPHIRGDELFRSLLSEGDTIPTILMTAYPDDAMRDRVLKEGVVCYLPKPVDSNHLLDCIRSTFDSSSSPPNS